MRTFPIFVSAAVVLLLWIPGALANSLFFDSSLDPSDECRTDLNDKARTHFFPGNEDYYRADEATSNGFLTSGRRIELFHENHSPQTVLPVFPTVPAGNPQLQFPFSAILIKPKAGALRTLTAFRKSELLAIAGSP